MTAARRLAAGGLTIVALALTSLPVYAATKRGAELLSHAYAHLHGLPQTGLRFFTVYGPWGRPDMAYFSFAQAIVAGESITVYDGGRLKRDFTYIDDIVGGVVDVQLVSRRRGARLIGHLDRV